MPKSKYDKVSAVLQTVLEYESQQAGRETAFVQRSSKVTAARFVQMLVLGCLEQADVSLADLVEVGEDLGVSVSASGLNQRIDDEAVVLMQRILQAALRHSQGEASVDSQILHAFTHVYIEDSSYISLPASLAGLYRGSGGNASAAGAKVYLNYEYRSGTLQALELLDGCTPDQAMPLPATPSPARCLRLFDLGFFKLKRLAQLMAQGDCFICRHQFQTALYTQTGERIDLEAMLDALPEEQNELEVEVLLGAQERLPVRLLCQRLPDAAAEQRRQRAKADAKRLRRPLSARKLRLAAWNLFCTNVPASLWSLAQVLAVYRLRWQIELLFKLWKSNAGLDRLGNWRPARILTQLYARLTALVLTHFLFSPLRFSAAGELSLPKAFRILRRMVPAFTEAIATGWRRLPTLIQRFVARCQRHAWKDKRRQKPSTYDHLSACHV
jgi:hypothetical protein